MVVHAQPGGEHADLLPAQDTGRGSVSGLAPQGLPGLSQPGTQLVRGLLGALPPLRRHPVPADPLGGTAVEDSITQALRRRQGGGQRLPDAVADPMGQELGIDTSTLRMHVDPEAGSIARSVQAEAFTYGNDLYFAPGRYQPSFGAGQRVLAHELSHVAAQRSGTDGGCAGPLSIGRSDDPAEAAADRSADRVVGALRRSRNHQPVVDPYSTLDSSVLRPLRRSAGEIGAPVAEVDPADPVAGDWQTPAARAAAGREPGLATPLGGDHHPIVGAVEDPAEHAADRAAASIVQLLLRTPSLTREQSASWLHAPIPSPLRRSAPPTGPLSEPAPAAQAAAAEQVGPEGGPLPGGLAAQLARQRGSGSRLPSALRRRLEVAAGAGLGGVRVHTGPAAADLNRRMNAQAFTQGNDIYFRDGLPDPTSEAGLTVLAHEVSHVVQSARNPMLRRQIRRSAFTPFSKLELKAGTAGTLNMDELHHDGLSYDEGGTLGNSVNMEHMVSNTGGSSSPGEPPGIWRLRSIDSSLVWGNGQMQAATAMHAVNGDFTLGTNDEPRNIFMGSATSNTDLHFHMVERPIRAAFQNNPPGRARLYETELAKTPPHLHPTMANILVWCGPNAVPGTTAVRPANNEYDHEGLPGHVTHFVRNRPTDSEAFTRPRFVQYHVTANYTYSPYPNLPPFLMSNIQRSLDAIADARTTPGTATEEEITNQERITQYLKDHADKLFPATFSCEAIYWVASYTPATPWFQQTEQGTYDAQKPGSQKPRSKRKSNRSDRDEDAPAAKKAETDAGAQGAAAAQSVTGTPT